MINISEDQVKIFDILNDMNREEVWHTMHILLTVLTVKDIKEANYDEFLDDFKNLALTQAKDFKQFVDKEKPHGHA